MGLMYGSLPRLLLASFALVALTADARAQQAEPDVDRRFGELLDRQKQLEQQLHDQSAIIRALQDTVALKPDGPSQEATAPLAGYSDRNFFFRDRHSWFVLVPKGRLNVDWYNFLNRPPPPVGVLPNSAADPRSALRDTIFIRRARILRAAGVAPEARDVDGRGVARRLVLVATGRERRRRRPCFAHGREHRRSGQRHHAGRLQRLLVELRQRHRRDEESDPHASRD